MNIRALKKSFVFQFKDAVTSKGEFNNGTSAGGIILQNGFDDSAKQSRWVTVVASGSDCDPVAFKPGTEVLLPALRWTEASKLEGQKIWKSDETQAAAYAAGGQLFPIGNYVIFILHKPEATQQSSSGLIVVSNGSGDTASGTVVAAGPKAAEELVAGTKFYFDDTNFTDTFEFNGIKHAFIKDDSILAYESV